MLNKFLNPKNDSAFKRIFGSEKNKDILIHFLNDMLGRTTNPIEYITFLPTVQDPETAVLRSSTVDVMCKDTEGNQFIVEMQVDGKPGFEKRAQYYAAKAYVRQSQKGVEYPDFKEIIFLAITDFTLFPDKTAYFSHHLILDRETNEHNLKDFSFTFLELPKFKKKKEALKTMVEKWAYFFKKAEDTKLQDLPLIVGSDTIIQRAFEELDQHGWTDAELRYYDSVEMKQMDDKVLLRKAVEEGEIKGEIKGKIKEKIEIAKKMLSAGMRISDIVLMTGLTEKAIRQL